MIEINATDLQRIMQCVGSRNMPASPRLEADNPQSSKALGVAAQYMAQMVFEGRHTATELVDRKAPNGVYMDATMSEHVDAFMNALPPSVTTNGMEVSTDNFIASVKVNGRANFIGYDTASSTLIVIDFRYGWTIVEPEENWALLFHAISWIISNQIQPINIVLSVFQPRPYHPDGKLREWMLTYPEIMEYYRLLQNTLGNLHLEMLRTGPECNHCPANGNCPAAREANMNVVEISCDAFTDNLPNDALSQELQLVLLAETRLKARKDALTELAKYRIKNGEIVEHFAVEMGLGNREWIEGATPELLKAMTGVDLSKPGLITPKQAEDKTSKELIAALTVRKPTGLKLVHESANKKATRLFGNKHDKQKGKQND